MLQFAQRVAPRDAGAACALGHLFFDRRRPAEAIALWERAVRLDPGLAIAWRNLGIAYFNVTRQPARARRAYEAARRADPANARLVYERDQLGQRLGESPAQRLRGLDRERALVEQRDDLALEYGALCLQVGRLDAARAVITGRRFQPWEGGEGAAARAAIDAAAPMIQPQPLSMPLPAVTEADPAHVDRLLALQGPADEVQDL